MAQVAIRFLKQNSYIQGRNKKVLKYIEGLREMNYFFFLPSGRKNSTEGKLECENFGQMSIKRFTSFSMTNTAPRQKLNNESSKVFLWDICKMILYVN